MNFQSFTLIPWTGCWDYRPESRTIPRDRLMWPYLTRLCSYSAYQQHVFPGMGVLLRKELVERLDRGEEKMKGGRLCSWGGLRFRFWSRNQNLWGLVLTLVGSPNVPRHERDSRSVLLSGSWVCLGIYSYFNNNLNRLDIGTLWLVCRAIF